MDWQDRKHGSAGLQAWISMTTSMDLKDCKHGSSELQTEIRRIASMDPQKIHAYFKNINYPTRMRSARPCSGRARAVGSLQICLYTPMVGLAPIFGDQNYNLIPLYNTCWGVITIRKGPQNFILTIHSSLKFYKILIIFKINFQKGICRCCVAIMCCCTQTSTLSGQIAGKHKQMQQFMSRVLVY